MSIREIFDLTGRVAVVTGGSVGLGRQMAEGLAEMGANLVLCARKQERCQQAAEELQKHGVQTLALACDVKDPASIRAVADAAVKQFGRIDILINNAAIFYGIDNFNSTFAYLRKIFDVNYFGTWLMCRAVFPYMEQQNSGVVLVYDCFWSKVSHVHTSCIPVYTWIPSGNSPAKEPQKTSCLESAVSGNDRGKSAPLGKRFHLK